MLKDVASRYYDYYEDTLKKHYKESTPYKNSCPLSNLDKWNKEISDIDIYKWKHYND